MLKLSVRRLWIPSLMLMAYLSASAWASPVPSNRQHIRSGTRCANTQDAFPRTGHDDSKTSRTNISKTHRSLKLRLSRNSTARRFNHQRGKAVINVKKYGAVGDGIADDTKSVQAAANAAAGKTLYFPKSSGAYMVAGIAISSGTTVRGKEAVVKLLALSGSSDLPVFDVKGSNITFDEMRIDGNRQNQKSAYQFCDCLLNGGGRGFRAGIRALGKADSISNLKILNSEFSNTYGAAIVTVEVSSVRIINNVGQNLNFELGYLLKDFNANSNVTDLVITGNHLSHISSGDTNNYITGNGFLVAGYNKGTISNNIGIEIDRDFIKIESGRDISIINNIAYKTGLGRGPYNYSGIEVTSRLAKCAPYTACGAQNINITGNTLYDVGMGIMVHVNPGGVNNLTIAKNNIRLTNASMTPDGIQISNDPDPATGLPSNTATNIKIEGNTLQEIKRFGMVIGAASQLKISNNILRGDLSSKVAPSNAGIVFFGYAPSSDVELVNNHISNFNGTGGQLIFYGNPQSAVYRGLIVRRNTIIASSSTANSIRAIDATHDFLGKGQRNYIFTGSLTDNYVEGTISWDQTNAVKVANNRVVENSSATVSGGDARKDLTAFPSYLTDTFSLNFPSIPANSCSTLKVKMKGAQAGNPVYLNTPTPMMTNGLLFTGDVTSPDTVSVKACNLTSSAVDPEAATGFTIGVLKS
jgi:polygalacturonase